MVNRRQFFKFSTALLALCAMPARLLAAGWNAPAFESTQLAQALKLLGASQANLSHQIQIAAPEKAENGAVVQVQVHSSLANTESIALLVEKNPTALIAQFDFQPGTLPDVITRIKMAETSNVIALVKAQGQFYYQQKQVEVMENGCG